MTYWCNATVSDIKVSEGKPANQSSTFAASTPPEAALDSNIHTQAHTENENSPWWWVDLQQRHLVVRVNLRNREDEYCRTFSHVYNCAEIFLLK